MTRSKNNARKGKMRPGTFRGAPIGVYGSMRPGIMGPGGNGLNRGASNKIMVTHLSFDPLMADSQFSRATEKFEDTQLSEALVKKIQELTPSTAEQSSVQNLVSKVEVVVESLIISSVGLNIPIDEVRAVGSYKKGTMLSGHPVADLVVILKDTPTAADIENLANIVQEKLKGQAPDEDFPTQANEGGFNTTSSEGALVRVLVTTLPKNLFEVDSEKHVDVKLLEGALATIRHARWFEENASHTTVRVLVRLLKDLKKRFSGLSGLTPWLIDLLAFKSATLPSNTRDPLSINVAFRRALQLLAAGLFLPGSLGVIDPCESGQVRAHSVLTLEEQDMLCLTAQTLIRALCHGAINEVLGIEGYPVVALDTDITSWCGTIVTPGQPAYIKEENKIESETDGKDETLFAPIES
ncbi:interleukin enhancer-binding factor 2 homolog isoform X2 [Hydra vulgaris]|uniref:Interleukin enhancer-binding factor 2 homolog isoform X2 n=1 Tax=Hydra vulgaris TaxID=6087 RepID=A0ABM4BXR4_HYDVU